MDPALKERLTKAGARTGQVTVSLKWDSTDDLDLYVGLPNRSGKIYYGNKKQGGAYLDVDMNVRHDTYEPVENVFWDSCPPGKYTVSWARQKKHNYTKVVDTSYFYFGFLLGCIDAGLCKSILI